MDQFFNAGLFELNDGQIQALGPYLGMCFAVVVGTLGAGFAWPRKVMNLLGFVMFAVLAAWHASTFGNADISVFGDSLVMGMASRWVAFSVCVFVSLLSLFVKEEKYGEWLALLSISATGLALLPAAGDWVAFFVYLETLAIPGYVLAALSLRRDGGYESGIKYLMMGALASSFLLMGLALVYGFSGSFNFTEIAQTIARLPDTSSSGLLFAGVLFLGVSLAFKVALAPFHMWAPDVYQSAPGPFAGFLASGTKLSVFVASFVAYQKSGFFDVKAFVVFLGVLAVLAIFVGNLMALSQKKVRRLLAYSSVASAGYAALAFVSTSTRVESLLVYLGIYGVSLLAAFIALDYLSAAAGKVSSSQLELKDLSKVDASKAALSSFVMVLSVFSMAGIPPLPGFFGKYMIAADLLREGHYSYAGFLVLGSLMGVAYYLRILIPLYFEKNKGPVAAQHG